LLFRQVLYQLSYVTKYKVEVAHTCSGRDLSVTFNIPSTLLL
jgi:hypothetical protein